jgi:hypothetical protein
MSEPGSPELLTRVHQEIWLARGKLAGATYRVSSCPYSADELAGPRGCSPMASTPNSA